MPRTRHCMKPISSCHCSDRPFPPPDASPFVIRKLPERSSATLPHRVGSYGDELRLSGQQSYRNAGRQAHYDRQGNTCLEEIRKTVLAGSLDQRVGLMADGRRETGGPSKYPRKTKRKG